MLEISVEEELEGLGRALGALSELRGASGKSEQVSAWSGDQQLYHIALATDLALSNVMALDSGKSPRIVAEPDPIPLALEVLERGSYPRGESEAPRIVQPPDEVDAALLADEYENLGGALEKVRALAAAIPGLPGAIPHQALGPLSAAQWLRFARLHAEHHLAIVEDIRRAVGD